MNPEEIGLSVVVTLTADPYPEEIRLIVVEEILDVNSVMLD